MLGLRGAASRDRSDAGDRFFARDDSDDIHSGVLFHRASWHCVGLTLGLLTSINLISDIRTDEPSIQLIFPWLTLFAIGAGAYLFTLVTIYLPAAQAARTAPAEAIRAE